MMRLILLVLVLTSTGCASMVNGRHQDVLVLSEPSGASIRLNGEDVGSTPTTVKMRRRGPAELVVAKPGFVAASIPVARNGSGWMFGNFVFLNPLAAQGMDSTGQWARSAASGFAGAMTLDLVTGGGFKRPPVVTVTLAPLPVPPDPPAATTSVAAAATHTWRATASCAPQTPPGCWPRGVQLDCPRRC